MRRTAAVALALLVLAVPAIAADPEAGPRRIVVAGSAEVEAAPDLAVVTAGVEAQAATAAEALAANSAAMQQVFAALASLAIEPRDIQTSQLNLEPVWSQTQPEDGTAPPVVAYRASNLVTVRLRQVDGVGGAIDAMTKAGANRLYGLVFDLAEPRAALDTARERAVADARARAELYARAAGVTLGPVQEIRENVMGPSPVMMRAEALDAGPPVSGGAVAVSASIEITYALE